VLQTLANDAAFGAKEPFLASLSRMHQVGV
jgi:hypothetical protein